MASVLAPVNKLIHEASTQLLVNNIPKQISDLVTTAVGSGFHIVEDVLKIVGELTKEDSPNGGGA